MKHMKLLGALTLILLSIGLNGMVAADYCFYDVDGSQIQLEICDTLVAIHMDTLAGGAIQFAAASIYLKDDTDFERLPGNFFVFRTEPGWEIEFIMEELRVSDSVIMVNPVLMSTGKPYYISNQIIARFNNDVSRDIIDSLLSLHRFQIFDSLGLDTVIYFLEYNEYSFFDILWHCNSFFSTGYCRYVQPNFQYTPEFFAGVPQDPYFPEQWHLHNTGQSGGTSDCDIDMPETWDLPNESMAQKLAILDFGFEMDHEDLKLGWSSWPYDVVGDWYIYALPWQPDYEPDPICGDERAICYHGTAILGLVAPIIDNTIGLAGIEDYGQIIPIKICDMYGAFNDLSVSKGFRYASTAPHSASVISCSWTMGGYTPFIEEELERLYNIGIPVFFATGNQGIVAYPASSEYTMAVGATDHNDNVYSMSGQGDSLDIVAPGVNMWSFDLSGDDGANPDLGSCNGDPNYYCYFTGTSLSTPIVAALATKILATRPSIIDKMRNAQPIYDLLGATADDLGSPGHDIMYGWGRVNAYKALSLALKPCEGRCGNANNDASVNVADAVWIINYVFAGGQPPKPVKGCGDANNDAEVNVSDAIWIINYVFAGGPPPGDCSPGSWFAHGGDCCPF